MQSAVHSKYLPLGMLEYVVSCDVQMIADRQGSFGTAEALLAAKLVL